LNPVSEPHAQGGLEMSENCRYYRDKMEARRVARSTGPLNDQLVELMAVVRRCEHLWALEDRIERSL
jgi:hypothetical protein